MSGGSGASSAASKQARTQAKASGVKEVVQKTYEMLNVDVRALPPDDPKRVVPGLVHWSDNGESFIVTDEGQFAKLVLPLYFRHQNFSSFVRSLNTYSFSKRADKNGHSHFTHPMFKRDQPELLRNIDKKPKETSASSAAAPSGGGSGGGVAMMDSAASAIGSGGGGAGGGALGTSEMRADVRSLQSEMHDMKQQIGDLTKQFQDLWKMQHQTLYLLSQYMQSYPLPNLPLPGTGGSGSGPGNKRAKRDIPMLLPPAPPVGPNSMLVMPSFPGSGSSGTLALPPPPGLINSPGNNSVYSTTGAMGSMSLGGSGGAHLSPINSPPSPDTGLAAAAAAAAAAAGVGAMSNSSMAANAQTMYISPHAASYGMRHTAGGGLVSADRKTKPPTTSGIKIIEDTSHATPSASNSAFAYAYPTASSSAAGGAGKPNASANPYANALAGAGFGGNTTSSPFVATTAGGAELPLPPLVASTGSGSGNTKSRAPQFVTATSEASQPGAFVMVNSRPSASGAGSSAPMTIPLKRTGATGGAIPNSLANGTGGNGNGAGGGGATAAINTHASSANPMGLSFTPPNEPFTSFPSQPPFPRQHSNGSNMPLDPLLSGNIGPVGGGVGSGITGDFVDDPELLDASSLTGLAHGLSLGGDPLLDAQPPYQSFGGGGGGGGNGAGTPSARYAAYAAKPEPQNLHSYSSANSGSNSRATVSVMHDGDDDDK